MKKNMGATDKYIRLFVAVLLSVLVYFKVLEGTLAYVALGLGAVFVLTSLVSFCPLYTIFGINTCKKE